MIKRILSKIVPALKVAALFLWMNIYLSIKQHIFFWKEGEVFSVGGKEALVTCMEYSIKHRLIPSAVMSVVYVIDFAILHKIGHISIPWILANVVILYWFTISAYLRGYADLLYRLAYYDVKERVEKQKTAKKSAKKAASKRTGKKR